MYTKGEPPADGSFTQLLDTVLQEKDSAMELLCEAAEALLSVKIVAPQQFDPAKMAAGIGQVAVDAYRQELATRDQVGRKLSTDGMTYYFTLVEKALEKLDAAAPSPKIKELQESLAELVESTTAEDEADPLAPPDPLKEEKQYDKVADSGAKFESLVTGKPISEILPKRAPVGGNVQAGAVGGGGYGSAGGRGYGAAGRGSVAGPKWIWPPVLDRLSAAGMARDASLALNGFTIRQKDLPRATRLSHRVSSRLPARRRGDRRV